MEKQMLLMPETQPEFETQEIKLESLPSNDRLMSPRPKRSLISTMKSIGLLQSIGVQKTLEEGRFLVIWGRKRIQAARVLGWETIRANVYDIDLDCAQIMTLSENEQRSDSLSVKIDSVEALRLKATPDSICKVTGLTKTEFERCCALLDGLIPELRQALAEGRISEGTARQALRLDSADQRSLSLLEKIRAEDVKFRLAAKMSRFLESLPSDLFELPCNPSPSWQEQAAEQIKSLEAIIPEDRRDLRLLLGQVSKLIDRAPAQIVSIR